ncbi:unnamed protein product [marine sediment metagenome]|uniref:Uncharacterized protein n=1 Tax=marine sediment metagenome TaxID=412755 RepID=X0XBS7_9ZZZZ
MAKLRNHKFKNNISDCTLNITKTKKPIRKDIIIIPNKVWNELKKDKKFIEIQNKRRKKYGFKEI